MTPSTDPVVLIAEFTARAGHADAVADLLSGLARNVRQEPGNVVFDCHRKVEDPDKFVVYEVYRDKLAFETHIDAPYGTVFNEQLQRLIVEPHSILTFLRPLATPDP